ncbi:MAG: hypothetical protein GYA55_04965 [SAR324 cluster bacterium]|uniref:Uncharacterized protein n=1 Tax=SAR324 cluster bacterium TaxID=2024889 RepID=A0A7X9FRH4_9DELT|nr:hypothetical protein [SAR324 cluster bacterium]
MKKFFISTIVLVLFNSCSGTDTGESFSPGIFEGQPEIQLSDDTLRIHRDSCRNLIQIFLSNGKYKIHINEDGEYFTVEHESNLGSSLIARIDKQQTAFGAEERNDFQSEISLGIPASCSFTFRGHFSGESSNTILESGQIEGKCMDEQSSLKCIFNHSVTLERKIEA